MKDIAIYTVIIIGLLCYTLTAGAQSEAKKEVLLMGTMHQVPKIVKHSYTPLLRRAKAYRPHAIYVETPRPQDSLSIRNAYPKFFATADSTNRKLRLSPERLTALLCQPLTAMTRADFKTLHEYYTRNYDVANAAYYQYLYRYGLEGSPKPSREEDGDLTAKLAIHLGLKVLRSMDNQWYRHDYHRAWAACNKADREDGEIDQLKKILSGLRRSEIFAALGRRLGLYTNSEKIMTKYHTLNSFRYRERECAPCTEGKALWDARNLEMARNIGHQIRENDQIRNLVIVGAGHVIGLRDALLREFPDIRVILLRE